MADNNDKYLNLITSQHKTKPLYKAYVTSFLNQLSQGTLKEGQNEPLTNSGIVNCYLSTNNLYKIDTAVGSQLDVIGQLVGINRKLPTASANITNPLTDDVYRLLIKAKILKNNWDGTFSGINNILYQLFPDYPWELIDNQDMTITFNLIYANITDEMKDLITLGYIIPKPSGVKINYNIQNSKAFGWDKENNFIAGWDEGAWVIS